MNINQLDDLCFVHIFGHFTPTELYQLSTVCKQWKLLVGFCVYTLKLQITLPDVEFSLSDNDDKENGKEGDVEGVEEEVDEDRNNKIDLIETRYPRIALRKSNFETIFKEYLINHDGKPMYRDTSRFDTIKLTGYDFNSIIRLGETFPLITKLEVYAQGNFTAGSNLSSLITFVESYYANLSSLELCIYCNSGTVFPRRHSARLFAFINRMFGLRHLTLDTNLRWFKYRKAGPHSRPQLVLPIIGRLKEFNFASLDRTIILRDSLQKYASSNENLLKIGYCYSDQNYKVNYLKELSRELSPQLCARFNILNKYEDIVENEMPETWNYIHITKLSPFVDLFFSLTTLSIQLDERKVSLYETFSRLLHLRQLTVLNIEYISAVRFEPSARPLPQLISVKVLTVNLIFSPHTYMACLTVPWTFPNVQVITLNRAGPFCGCATMIRNCEINIGLLLKDCQHLRALFINGSLVSMKRLLLLGQRFVADEE